MISGNADSAGVTSVDGEFSAGDPVDLVDPGGVAVARGLDLDPVAAAVLILQVSTPVAVTQYMLAAKYGGDAEAVAGLVIVSTLVSVATLPLTLAFLI